MGGGVRIFFNVFPPPQEKSETASLTPWNETASLTPWYEKYTKLDHVGLVSAVRVEFWSRIGVFFTISNRGDLVCEISSIENTVSVTSFTDSLYLEFIHVE